MTTEQRILEAENRREASKLARETQRNAATMAPMDFFTTSSKGTKLAQAPDGVPSILSWTQRKDGMFMLCWCAVSAVLLEMLLLICRVCVFLTNFFDCWFSF